MTSITITKYPFDGSGSSKLVCVSRKIFLNQFNWNTVCGAIQDLPWRNIWLAGNPVEVLNEHLSLLVGCYVPTKVICVRNKD